MYSRYNMHRSTHWWDYVVLTSDQDWIENFHVSKATFFYLYQQLKSLIKRSNAILSKAICVEHWLAITFVVSSYMWRVQNYWPFIWRTICIIVHETCAAIVSKLLKQHVYFPQDEQLAVVIDGFKWYNTVCRSHRWVPHSN